MEQIAGTNAGWTVESSQPGLVENNGSLTSGGNSIAATLELPVVPAGTITTWPVLDFSDPEAGFEGSFSPSSPFPNNTPANDQQFGVRATGRMVVTVAGDYHIGFQGDDGGYLIIRNAENGGGTPNPSFNQTLVFTNHPQLASIIEEEFDSGVFNQIYVDTPTPNSRTIASVSLEPGIYEIQTLLCESTNNAFWEVFASQATDRLGFTPPLLSVTGTGPTTAPSPRTRVGRTGSHSR